MIIGVTGYAQHGKNTVGERLQEAWGFQRFAFADALKDLAEHLNPLVGPPDTRLFEVVSVLGWDNAKAIPEVRRTLQALGMAARDIIGEDVWVRAVQRAIKGVSRAVITDVRFPNEADYVHENGGVLLRVVRPNFDNGVGTDHPSEALVAELPADHVIVNDDDIRTLHKRVDVVVVGLLGGVR